ncbi:protein ZINC INDUCED FACILITATOR-LIKE [Trifolium repens]|nr:protein ZINC INDUCED FACILITATOR-LIKE [Trifolium repens]
MVDEEKTLQNRENLSIIAYCVFSLHDIAYQEVFNDPTALTDEDLYELRNRWATFFFDLYNPENDYDDGAEEGS